MRLRLVPILLAALPLLIADDSDRIDAHYYYRLTNTFLGEAYSLDTRPDAPNEPFMGESGDYSGQQWKFSFHDGCYRLTNAYLGLSRSLDNLPDGDHAPQMGQTGNYSGQCWHLTPEHDGYVRLTNDFLGNSHSLDTHSGGGQEPFMGESGDYSGQYWRLTRLRRID